MNETYDWYQTLIKPSWAPPSWLFGPVWSVLYIIITISFGAVFYKVYTRQIPRSVILPFLLNLVFNLSFTPLQFGLKSNLLALADILLVLTTLIWSIIKIWSYARWIAIVNGPYLLWVSFATVLQATITYLNR